MNPPARRSPSGSTFPHHRQMNSDTIYLGDGLYAKYDGAYLVFVTNKHIDPTNRVCIELHGLPKLQEFISLILKLRKAQQP